MLARPASACRGHLPEADARVLLAALLPEKTDAAGLRQRVLERTGGVPIFLISCVQVLQTGALERAEKSATRAVPWTVAETIHQRLMSLPLAAQELLSSAAVVGQNISRELLLTVTPHARQKEEEMVAGLQACCQSRLLLKEGEHAYLFAHDLIREVVLADLGAARRGGLSPPGGRSVGARARRSPD